ncbi:DUF2929 domain-containing protein [Bacillus atrophaeus]|uniref:DUF2929 family protein n=1 Tax=Bacillus atrophaeus (strain 1942) TaxID=720555 RepID=A0ABN3Z6I8_BACA1|nr:YjzD family protein [Bacillus atrophaeus]AMR63437.1 hypothetical protein A1D11_13870 [Bacillus subtilis subsp. globigii]MBT2626234.1 YjzD family protein [Bacillus sp. ISL-32]ADP31609.1 hypothetical protein BATR1942_03265 [Bacillus atrophaeus 1942]AIK45666.1 hypothetical protein DJ95_585 [Bacillus atrophaeus subsp. globigii]AKL83871.1 YjzD [Bacillus atrophaeus UCMB-5137]
MRFIVAFIWTFLLSHMACYLIASMNRAEYNVTTSSVIAVIITVLVIVLGEMLPMKNETSQQH